MNNTARNLVAGIVALGLIALVGWLFLVPSAPETPAEKPWSGAAGLAGTWRLHQEQPLQSCRESTDYVLTLDKPAPPLDDAVRGRLAVRQARGCPSITRAEAYSVIVAMDSFRELELTMTPFDCSEDGKPCAQPATGRRGRLSLKGGQLLFGNAAMTKD